MAIINRHLYNLVKNKFAGYGKDMVIFMADDDKLIIRSKKYKGNDGYKTFSIRIREEIVENIDSISDRTGHSRNELIGILLEYAVNHCIIKD